MSSAATTAGRDADASIAAYGASPGTAATSGSSSDTEEGTARKPASTAKGVSAQTSSGLWFGSL